VRVILVFWTLIGNRLKELKKENMNKEKIVRFVKKHWRGFIIGLIVGYLMMRFIFN